MSVPNGPVMTRPYDPRGISPLRLFYSCNSVARGIGPGVSTTQPQLGETRDSARRPAESWFFYGLTESGMKIDQLIVDHDLV